MALITFEELKKLPDISIRMYKSIYNVPAEATLEELAIAMGILDKPEGSKFGYDDFYNIVKSEFEIVKHEEGKISEILGVNPDRMVFELPPRINDTGIYNLPICFVVDEDIVISKDMSKILSKYNVRELAYISYFIAEELIDIARETVKNIIINFEKIKEVENNITFKDPFIAYTGSPVFGGTPAIAIECILDKYAKLEEYDAGVDYAEKFMDKIDGIETYSEMYEYIFLELSKHGEQVLHEFIKRLQINGFLAINIINDYGEYLIKYKKEDS